MWRWINVFEWDIKSGKPAVRFIQNWLQLSINPHFVWGKCKEAKQPASFCFLKWFQDWRGTSKWKPHHLPTPPCPFLTWTLVHLRRVPYKCQLLSVLCRKIRRKEADKGKGKRRGKSVETWIAWRFFFLIFLFLFIFLFIIRQNVKEGAVTLHAVVMFYDQSVCRTEARRCKNVLCSTQMFTSYPTYLKRQEKKRKDYL